MVGVNISNFSSNLCIHAILAFLCLIKCISTLIPYKEKFQVAKTSDWKWHNMMKTVMANTQKQTRLVTWQLLKFIINMIITLLQIIWQHFRKLIYSFLFFRNLLCLQEKEIKLLSNLENYLQQCLDSYSFFKMM